MKRLVCHIQHYYIARLGICDFWGKALGKIVTETRESKKTGNACMSSRYSDGQESMKRPSLRLEQQGAKKTVFRKKREKKWYMQDIKGITGS